MTFLWTAFLLGLVGSLHCAGMCGPLALAVPTPSDGGLSFTLSRLLYNAGRTLTYCGIGAVFGLIGHSFAVAGFQRWISLIAGAAILCGLLLSSRVAARTPALKLVGAVKKLFGTLLKRRTAGSLFLLGAVNGLLPCGLVYVAAAGAVASGGFTAGVLYMAAFGLGTWPLMLGVSLAGRRFQFALALRLQRLIPGLIAFVAVLLLLRGMGLGIPYVSPAISKSPAVACH